MMRTLFICSPSILTLSYKSFLSNSQAVPLQNHKCIFEVSMSKGEDADELIKYQYFQVISLN